MHQQRKYVKAFYVCSILFIVVIGNTIRNAEAFGFTRTWGNSFGLMNNAERIATFASMRGALIQPSQGIYYKSSHPPLRAHIAFTEKTDNSVHPYSYNRTLSTRGPLASPSGKFRSTLSESDIGKEQLKKVLNKPIGSLTKEDAHILFTWMKRLSYSQPSKTTATLTERLVERMVDDILAGNANLRVRKKSFVQALMTWRIASASDAPYRAIRIHNNLMSLYKQTKDSSIRPNAAWYTSVIQSWKKSQDPNAWELVEPLCHDLLSLDAHDISNTQKAVAILLRLYSISMEASRMEKAENLVKLLEQRGIPRISGVDYFFLQVYSSFRGIMAYEKSLKLLHKLIDSEMHRDPTNRSLTIAIYKNVLNTLWGGNKELAEIALKFLKQMETPVTSGGYGIQPDLGTYFQMLSIGTTCTDVECGSKVVNYTLERLKKQLVDDLSPLGPNPRTVLSKFDRLSLLHNRQIQNSIEAQLLSIRQTIEENISHYHSTLSSDDVQQEQQKQKLQHQQQVYGAGNNTTISTKTGTANTTTTNALETHETVPSMDKDSSSTSSPIMSAFAAELARFTQIPVGQLTNEDTAQIRRLMTKLMIPNQHDKVFVARSVQSLLQRLLSDIRAENTEIVPSLDPFSRAVTAWKIASTPEAPTRILQIHNDLILLYNQTKDERYRPNVYWYSSVIEAFWKVDSPTAWKQVEPIFYDMISLRQRKGPKLIERAAHCLLKLYQKSTESDRVERAEKVLKQIESFGITRNSKLDKKLQWMNSTTSNQED